MNRIILGKSVGNAEEFGLFVSVPGVDVLHPDNSQGSNLMFDSSTTLSTFNVIQTGTFKITCSRKAISARGETIGTRPNDNQELFLDGGTGHINAHTFSYDTGRPSNMTTVANWDVAQTPGYHNKSHGRPVKGKQSNYLDTGSHTIQLASSLPNGEIPKVALRFAVGNSSGHFHPWYANTKIKSGRSGGDWDDIDYASGNTQQMVHMDSNWMRLKWGGLGAEEYMGIQNEYFFPNSEDSIEYHDAVVAFFNDDASAAAANLGFSSSADMETKLKNSKLLSSAINNSQGIVGLVPYVGATSITVDAYMSPTHAGLRQPVDRTFEKNKGRQKGVGFNAIDDFAHINFPMESHPHTNTLSDTQISEELNARKFKHLPGIPPPGDIYRADGGDFDNEDHGKRDMFGWGGHPTEFFVNPFSNANLTFYTHMQPPYVTNKGTKEVSGNTYTGHYIPIGYAGEPSDGTNQVWGPDMVGPDVETAVNTLVPGHILYPYFWLSVIDASWDGGENLVNVSGKEELYLLNPAGFGLGIDTAVIDDMKDYLNALPQSGYLQVDEEIIGPFTEHEDSGFFHVFRFPNSGIRGALGTAAVPHSADGSFTGLPIIKSPADEGGSVTRTASEHQWHKGTANTPSRAVFSGAGVKWPPGDPHADYLDHRDWTGSMGLAGAGSKEAMAVDDVWDTFYCSYTVYSTGSSIPEIVSPSLPPKTYNFNVQTDLSAAGMTKRFEWSDWITPAQGQMIPGLNANEGGGSVMVNWNLVFPDDFVGTPGDVGTDPFHDRRDALGRIIGNVNIIITVPVGTKIGSRNGSSITRKPEPALHLDFGDNKWDRTNNQDITVTIVNSGVIVGGAGAGGFGGRDDALVAGGGGGKGNPGGASARTVSSVGGGGGGAGGGTGRWGNEGKHLIATTTFNGYGGEFGIVPMYSITGDHEQVGLKGPGWGAFEEHPTVPSSHLALTAGNHSGSSGQHGTDFWNGGVGGAAATFLTNLIGIDVSDELITGGDGGDVIFVTCNPKNQISLNLISSKLDVTNPSPHATWILAGGGGGAGGFEMPGSAGGKTGLSGNRGKERTDITSAPDPDPLGRDRLFGGDPGYVVGSLNNSYTKPVNIYCISESGATSEIHGVKGRNPDVGPHSSHTGQAPEDNNGPNLDFVFQNNNSSDPNKKTTYRS